MKRLLRHALLALAVIVVLLLSLVWLGRDWPRRTVERALAQELGARVRLGSLTLQGRREFLLEDLTVTDMASEPRLERLHVRSLEVRGGLRDLRAGRFGRLRFVGVEAHLVPAAAPPLEQEDETDVVVGRLEIEQARVVIRGGEEETVVSLEGVIHDIGDGTRGEFKLVGERVALAPLVLLLRRPGGARTPPAARGALHGVEATVRLGDNARVEARASAAEILARGLRVRLDEPAAQIALRGRPPSPETVDASASAATATFERPDGWSMDLAAPVIEGSASRDGDDGSLRVLLTPRVPYVGPIRVRAELDPDGSSVRRFEAEAVRVELERWLPILAPIPEGFEVGGLADVAASGSPEAVDYSLAAQLSRLTIPLQTGVLSSAFARLESEGTIVPDRSGPGGPVRAKLHLGSLEGSVGGLVVPAGLCPVSLEWNGRIAADEVVRLEGRVALGSPGAGVWAADGSVSLSDPTPTLVARWEWEETRLASLIELAAAAGFDLPEGLDVAGVLRAAGTIQGDLHAPTATAELTARELEASERSDGGEPPWRFSEGSARVVARRPGGDAPVEIDLRELAGMLAVAPLEAAALTATGSATVRAGPGRFELAKLEVASEGLFRATVRGVWTPTEEVARGEARIDGEDLSRWQPFLRPLLGDAVAGYQVKGKPAADLRAHVDASGVWTLTGEASVKESGLNSEDFARVVEGLDTTWDLTAEGGGETGAVRAEARARVGGFQLLWGSFFADYSDAEATLEVSARGKPGETGRSWRGRVGLSVPGGPRVATVIETAPEEPARYSGRIGIGDLRTTFDRYLRRPFEGSVTAIEKLRARGVLEGEVSGTSTRERRTAEGRLVLRGLGLGGAQEQVEVGGLDLDLPFHLVWEGAGPKSVSGEDRAGRLRFDRLKFGGIDFTATETDLVVRGDSVRIGEGLAVPFLGGVLGFEELTLAELLRPSRHLETAILLHQVSLRELTDSIGLFPLEGEMEGYFPRVRLTESTFRTEGDARFNLFGGELVVSDIEGEDLLSRYPKLSFSATFREIDLAGLTRTFDFGEMTGTLQGNLDDCELFRGVPVRFDGVLETVKRPGVGQTINVKAINNISILGTGGKVGVLDRGIQRFFDKYTYRKLGMRMALSNDRFVLRGLTQENGKEYFVRGRLPFPINVVNVKPGQAVSFRVMTERLRNLDFEVGSPPAGAGNAID